ncbi:MAG: hypothetical protein KF841_10035 [Phycisphaerae bacterium]|nr:hypothetical protein [Phycisphaerae bacterium]
MMRIRKGERTMVFIGTGHGTLATLGFMLFAMFVLMAFVVIGRAVARCNQSDAFKDAKPDFFLDKYVSPFASGSAVESGAEWTCNDPMCRASNSAHARFCRLCGTPRNGADSR